MSDPNYDRERLQNGWIDMNRDDKGNWRISWKPDEGQAGWPGAHVLVGRLGSTGRLSGLAWQGRPLRVGTAALGGCFGTEWELSHSHPRRRKAQITGAFP